MLSGTTSAKLKALIKQSPGQSPSNPQPRAWAAMQRIALKKDIPSLGFHLRLIKFLFQNRILMKEFKDFSRIKK